MPKVKVNDVELYYEVHGRENSDWMVLIMGLGLDSSAWRFQVPEFTREYRVLVFDNRGVGRSDKPDTPYSIKTFCEDTVGLMDRLDIGKAHVVSASMGGMIGQELAINHPERVRSLTLACTAAYWPKGLTHLDVAREMMEKKVDQELFIKNGLVWVFTEDFLQNDEAVKTLLDQMLNYPHPQPPEAYIRQVQAIKNFDARNRLHNIKAPTLVLVGNKDIATPPWHSEELAEKIPGAKLVMLDGGGHAFNIEIPEKFNKAVLDFVRKH